VFYFFLDFLQILEDAKKQSKIFELYDLMHQSESMAAALPEVVDRLEALQALHEQGMSFQVNFPNIKQPQDID